MPIHSRRFGLASVSAASFRRHMATTCTIALLALAGLSVTGSAQTMPPLDTTALPRPAAIKQLAAFPQTTIFLSADTVPVAARNALTLLETAGWQRYDNPFMQPAPQATSEIYTLKKGPHGLNLMVDKAPAQNNATVIHYTAAPSDRDLPFPAKAENIKYAPDRLHLDATVPQMPTALLAFYRLGLAAAGWTLHSASDGSAPKQVDGNEGLQHAFFTHATLGALHVTATKKAEGQSTIAIRSVPVSVLPGAQIAQKVEPVAEQPNPHAMAHAQMSQKMDGMVQDLMKQAMQQPPKNPAFEAAAAAALKAAQRRAAESAMPQQQKIASNAADTKVADEPALERDETGGLPIPKPYSAKEHTRSQWRLEANAGVKASLEKTLAFYRTELAARGWREDGQIKTEAGRTVLNYTSAEGPAVLTLERKRNETMVNLLLRKESEARASGMMPKSGQAKIMFGNMNDGESTVMIAGRTIKVAVGAGAKAPNGPALELPPGVHKVTIRSAGQPESTEMVTVRANEIWGVLLGPGGALPLQMY